MRLKFSVSVPSLFLLLFLAACSDTTPDFKPAPPPLFQPVNKANDEPKQVAITIDDGPVVNPFDQPSEWHRRLIIDSLSNALARFDAPLTLFVIGQYVEEANGSDLLNYWLEKGVDIGNHTMTHPDFGRITYEEGVKEIKQAQDLLSGFKKIRYFRFPLLAEGSTREIKDGWQTYLTSTGLIDARVTISTRDWEYNSRYATLEKAEEWEKRYDVGQEYLQHIRESIDFWDKMATDLFHRNVKHVFLIHANRINRDYLGQILAEFQTRGFDFISLDEAYTDPLYQEKDEYVSVRGTSFLENIKETRKMEGK